MPIKRTYAECGDACMTARAVELIGDRWTYPVLRELMLAPKRFKELAAAICGVTPAVLTTRLREMEAAGLVERVVLAPPASVAVYRLTPWARELEPTLHELGRWAHRQPDRPPTCGGLTPDGVVQSMLTMAPPEPPEPPVRLQLDLHDERSPSDTRYGYRLDWDDDGLHIARGTHPAADAHLRTGSTALAEMLYDLHGLPPEGDGAQVEGDRDAVERLLAAFSDA